ncbi:hypothetical protein Patl1_04480 [Pistacia atlantica]|uniref:Uncharacterized protein n=1 Tax=Pistacia atlantica TaxID=434234 RepID=A0ACC1BWU4_9ROSI|nr:hypothetical protein Patl1_04480 [Pistacia atlantica]
MAYTNSDISGGGSGCTMWFGDLMDMKQFPAGGQDLYIRMSASEKEKEDNPKMKILVITSIAVAVVAGVLIVSYCIYKRNIHKRRTNTEGNVILFVSKLIVNRYKPSFAISFYFFVVYNFCYSFIHFSTCLPAGTI